MKAFCHGALGFAIHEDNLVMLLLKHDVNKTK